jgi:hypothetical protein
MTADSPIDLVVLVPGKDEREALMGLLQRHSSLHIRPIRFQVLDPHPQRDPGCFRQAPEILGLYCDRARHALVLFDREGSGQERSSANEIAADVETRLRRSGWGDRARAIVLDPELEAWVWSDSPHVERVLGWEHRSPGLREWLCAERFLEPGATKPGRPKEALEAALRASRVQRSSSLYRKLAENVSLSRCTDTGFLELRSVLAAWFPHEGGPKRGARGGRG